MPFMIPYWATVILFAVLTIASFIGYAMALDFMDDDFKPRSRRRVIRTAATLGGIALLLGFAGIWIPFFIPGLY